MGTRIIKAGEIIGARVMISPFVLHLFAKVEEIIFQQCQDMVSMAHTLIG
jgi:hypothetical protein